MNTQGNPPGGRSPSWPEERNQHPGGDTHTSKIMLRRAFVKGVRVTRPSEINEVFTVLVRYGLGMKPSELNEAEHRDQRRIIKRMLEENDVDILIDAIKYGMPNVWPFSEDGRAFAALDLEQNLLKAKAEAAVARREGRIAYRPGRLA